MEKKNQASDFPIGSASLFKTSIAFTKREKILKGKIFFQFDFLLPTWREIFCLILNH